MVRLYGGIAVLVSRFPNKKLAEKRGTQSLISYESTEFMMISIITQNLTQPWIFHQSLTEKWPERS
jgi:hypothetical protein